jgi:hypothetical protein
VCGVAYPWLNHACNAWLHQVNLKVLAGQVAFFPRTTRPNFCATSRMGTSALIHLKSGRAGE